MKKKLSFILTIVLLTPMFYIKIGTCNELDKCIKLLRSKSSSERILGLSDFTKFNRKVSQKNIGLIIPLLYDENEQVRKTAIYSIGNIFLESTEYNVLKTPHFQMPRLEKDDTYIKAAELILPHLTKKLKKEEELLQRHTLTTIDTLFTKHVSA